MASSAGESPTFDTMNLTPATAAGIILRLRTSGRPVEEDMTMSRGCATGVSLALLGLLLPACSLSTPTRAAAPASLAELAKQSLARLDGDVKVLGLVQPVEIIRDQQGIPHIYAKNDDDLFFAQGYVMAQDRLWQLEMWRRWHEGRLAEIFGPKALRLRRADAAVDVPRSVGREGVDELPPRRRAPLHRVGQRPQRLRRRSTPTTCRSSSRSRASSPTPWTAKTVTLRWAQLGLDSASGTPDRRDPLARDVAKIGREGSQPARGAGSRGTTSWCPTAST